MPIGSNIKQIREIYGLSQKEFGEIAGVTDKAVSTWEQGIKTPRMGTIQKIADYFGIQKSNLIEDKGLDNIVFKMTPEEVQIIKKYRKLDPRGQEHVKDILERESLYSDKNITIAAHSTSREVTEEDLNDIASIHKFMTSQRAKK